ncbi:hypothetical protein [Streptomyces coeruleorubidus]|uniref:hypothetical protein n=1 Tax=Streptomyces coeruleorubidus TaxID=116188 RepID=UPI0019BE8656|nr:hypothetical protein [Streptomyces coeruleorubidus]GGU11535.1 hypothetical protein GCM10010256_83770 [Streptomyces coeruleorubidus]
MVSSLPSRVRQIWMEASWLPLQIHLPVGGDGEGEVGADVGVGHHRFLGVALVPAYGTVGGHREAPSLP